MCSPGQLENANLKEEGALVDPNSPPPPVEPPNASPAQTPPPELAGQDGEPRLEADGQQGAPLAQGVAQHCQVPRLAPGQGAEQQRLGQGQGGLPGLAGPGAAGRGGDAERRPGGTGRPVAGNAGGLVPRTAPGAGAAERGEEETPEVAGADECRDTAHCGEVGTLHHNVACVEERMAHSTHKRARDVVFPMVSSPGSMGRGWGARLGPRAPCPMAGVLVHGPGPQTACPKRWSPRSPWAVEHSWATSRGKALHPRDPPRPPIAPQEVLDAFHTRLSQREAQQQAAQLEKQDRSGAPQWHLHGQLVNLAVAVATILLVCISAAWACGLPLLRSRRRALSTLGVLALLSLAGHCWEGTCW
ncbi:unnamed protein product [Eretmochelys imbricata]